MGAPLIERGTEAGKKERVVCWLGLFLFVCVCVCVTGEIYGREQMLRVTCLEAECG